MKKTTPVRIFAVLVSFLLLSLLIQGVGATIVLHHLGEIHGAGSPNYLNLAYDIDVIGDYAYVVSYTDDALTIFNISDPANPTHVGEIHGAGSPNYLNGAWFVKVVGNYAYVAADNDDALTIFDISDPANPSHVGNISGAGSPNYLNGAHGMDIVGDYAYAMGYQDDTLTIFNISDPANPAHVGNITGAGSPNYLDGASFIDVVGNYAYVTGYSDDALTIFNISDPANPTHVGEIHGAGSPNYLSGAKAINVTGNYAYVTADADTSFTIFNISDPANPAHVGEIHGAGSPNYLDGGDDINIIGNYAYIVSSWDSALTVFNISDPSNPTHVDEIHGAGSPNYLGSAMGVSVVGDYAYVVSEDDFALTIFLIDNLPTTPTLISPTNGSNSTDRTPFFNWTTSTDADGDSITYTIQIDNESTFSSPYVYENATTITNSNHTLAAADVLIPDQYYWRVRAYDTYENSSWATHFNFTVDNNAPTTPTFISPADGDEDTDTTPFFNWTTSTDADGDSITYTIQIDDEAAFTSPLTYENTTLTNSNLTLAAADALDDGLFYWRVRAYDTYGYGEWSGYGTITDAVIDTLEFDTAWGVWPDIIHISGDVYAIAYEGTDDDGFLKTVEIFSAGAITDTVIDTLEFDTSGGEAPEIIHISGDVYAIVYNGDYNDGFLKTVEISSTGAITDAVIDTLEFDTVQGLGSEIIHVSGDVYAIAYEGVDNDGFLKTVEITTAGAITDAVIDTLEFDTVFGNYPQIIHISGDVYAIAYQGVDDDGFLKTVEISTAGAITNTIIDTLEFDTVFALAVDIIHISGNVYAIAYDGGVSKDKGFLKTVEISTAGTITDTVIDTLEFETVEGYTEDFINITGDIYAVVYLGVDDDGYGGFLKTVEISTAGAITDTVIDELEFDTGWGEYPKIIHISGRVYAIAYEGADSDGFLKTVEINRQYFNFTTDATPPVISNMARTPASVYEGETVTISCDAVDAGVGMGSVWVRVKDSKDREANHTLSLVSGSSYSLDYGFTGKFGTFYILYFYANDTLGNEAAEASTLSFFVKSTGGGVAPAPPSPTPTVTPFPQTCDEKCRGCAYLSGVCRLDGCRCNEFTTEAEDCKENAACCCLKSLDPCPTATPTPEEEPSDIIEIIARPFKLLGDYLQRVFFYTPFMPDEINQTKQFPWENIADKPLVSCMTSAGECYVQPDDAYSIFIAYTESREDIWASKEFIKITIYDVDDYPAWAKMDILILNLAAYFNVPGEKWDVSDGAFWHYLFKFQEDINNKTWVTGVRVWWLLLVALAAVIGSFGGGKRKRGQFER